MPSPPQPGRMLLRAVIFLTVFAIVLLLVVQMYLIPAMLAAKDADASQRRQLSAYATLILAVVLFVLFSGLLLTFRVGRFFFPRNPGRTLKRTEYVDAWAEAGRRAAATPLSDDDDKAD